jgi:hypothetical protein
MMVAVHVGAVVVNNVLFLGMRAARLQALAVFIGVFPLSFWQRRRARR